MGVHTVAITGGPCAGKTTVLDALRDTYGAKILFMPEVPTILFTGGFPRPGIDVAYSDDWFWSFQEAVIAVQRTMEGQYLTMAKERGIKVVVFDRGLIDGGAYVPGGHEGYFGRFNLTQEEAYSRYDLVIQLQSVATCRPELWETLKEVGALRYETLEEAQERDRRLGEVWGGHPNWCLLSGADGLEPVVGEAVRLVGEYLKS